MIRIAHVINELEIGGAETQLVHVLRRIDRKRFHPSVVYLFGEGTLAPKLCESGIETHCAGLSRWNTPFALIRLIRLVRRLAPDVVHTHLVHATVLGMMSRFFAGRFACVVTKHSAGGRRGPAQSLEPWAVRRADRVVAVSEAVAGALVELGRPASAIEVVPNGLDFDWFDRAAAGGGRWPARGENRGSGEPGAEGEMLIGALGNWGWRKGLDLLLDAFTIVRTARPGTRLWIGGPVPAAAGASDRGVTSWGPLPHEEVPSFLAQLDVFVQPSRREGFGLSALEAMAAGKPVVAASVGGLSHLVENEQTGLLVEPENAEALAAALTRLAGDAAWRRRLGAAGRLRAVTGFSIEATVRRLERLYEEIAHCKRPAALAC